MNWRDGNPLLWLLAVVGVVLIILLLVGTIHTGH